MLQSGNVRFRRNAEGKVLLCVDGAEQVVAGVVSAFPLTHRHTMVSLRGADGEEIGILDDVGRLDEDSRRIIRQELDRSYFMPRITDIMDLSESMNVEEWKVQTDKGPHTFLVRGARRNVRRMGRRRLVIKDVDGNRYDIPDWMSLPPYAQKLLEPYM